MSDYPLTPCFQIFLERISLNKGQKEQLKNAQIALRRKLREDEKLGKIVETTFIQGSYGRGTALRPRNGKISDIDIVVVTKLDGDEYTPDEALGLFKNFIAKHYKTRTYRTQTHSNGIRMQHAHVDLVPAIAPSLMQRGILGEKRTSIFTYNNSYSSLPRMHAFKSAPAEEIGEEIPEWKRGILYIPNRDVNKWKETDPQSIIRRTRIKNKKCNGNYTQVVKCLKWWRREWFPEQKYLKSYPIEWLVEKYCDDNIRNVEDGILSTLEGIAKSKGNWRPTGYLSYLFPSYDPFDNLTSEQFNAFFESVNEALEIATEAYYEEDLQAASNLWRKLFGGKFPRYSEVKKMIH